MYWLRRLLVIKSVELTLLSIVRYELVFLPLLIVAFALIIPFTQSVRYLTENYPSYSFTGYWEDYMLYIYNWYVYFRYLVPMLLLGYGALNLSLLLDYIKAANYPNRV
jgi:two-component system LytT family response regulator